jgi:hypothetical protein
MQSLFQPKDIQFDKGRTHTGPGGQGDMHKWNTQVEYTHARSPLPLSVAGMNRP